MIKDCFGSPSVLDFGGKCSMILLNGVVLVAAISKMMEKIMVEFSSTLKKEDRQITKLQC